jgi:tagatose-6-phosphate ketose/aldose isomerase
MSETISAPSPQAEGPDCWTHREILQQPETLLATQQLLERDEAAIAAFLAPLLAQPQLRIVLTGAGTSAFIGDTLAPWLSRLLNRDVEAIATTDIVSAPSLYLRAEAPTLLVSFGRSGNSPESLVAVELAEARIATVHHLIITCNGEGALARRGGGNSHVVVLPEATHDRGYAMTSSFTAMTLAALSIFSGIGTMGARVERIVATTAAMLDESEARMVSLAAPRFERVVYLGSGPFKGLAREAALKLMELTDGALVTTFDSPLGFRHGPKTIITDRTLAIIFLSNDPLTRRYDLDLVSELRKDGVCGAVLTISAQPVEGDSIAIADAQFMADIDLLFPFIVPAQLFGVHAALALGLAPDQPNVTGTVSRVVQGVRIYADS